MAQTTFQVTLAIDGAHTVSVSTDDAAEMKAALDWATATYIALVERYGGAAQQSTPNVAPADQAGKQEPDAGEPPVCPYHQKPMVLVQGKRSPFWSCHERNADGRFCSYRPETSAA